MRDGAKDDAAISKESFLGTRGSSRGKWLALAVALLVVAAAVAGALAWRSSREAAVVQYRTEPAARGNLVVTVTATGSLQPTNKVDVGSELSGIVESVLVDANDSVKKGQVLAQLDLSKLNDQVVRAKSALASSQAKVKQAEATYTEANASLARLEQVRQLSGGKVPSQAELATAQAALERAQADQAAARAAVADAQAALRSDETNVRKATIRAPINGVVLARKIDPGQTVAASFQAPVLFTLAEDLRQMELQVDVDEADVGRVRKGQMATFSVDAYPNRRYPAKVIRVDFGSQVKDNVVTYPTLLAVNNDDLSLRPGMTATAEITAATRNDVLLLPNAALRFTPPAPAQAAKDDGGFVSKLVPRMPRRPARKAGSAGAANGEQRVWVLQGGQPLEVAISVGLSDGRHTEVTGGNLAPGAAVIVDAAQPRAK